MAKIGFSKWCWTPKYNLYYSEEAAVFRVAVKFLFLKWFHDFPALIDRSQRLRAITEKEMRDEAQAKENANG